MLILAGTSCTGLGITADLVGEREDATQGDGLISADITTENLGQEVPLPDVSKEDELFFDVHQVDLGPGCAPGEGCFLDKCEENTQCQSGWCVEHMGEGVCSMNCQEECPPGWNCKLLAGTGPDPVYVCISDHSNLCKPCASNGDCQSEGAATDACISYDKEGSFCGGACEGDDDCPWGFTCMEAQTVESVPLMSCVADAGVCPCTGKSAALGLSTPCSIDNQWGQCSGKRVCSDIGLADCDAAVPAQEICNSIDDNCDGDIDEGYFVEGQPVNLCDDSNDCTKDTCKGEDGCVHEDLTQGECMDGDACTVGDHCEVGVCLGTPVPCDDDNVCTDDSCDGLGGCKFENNVLDCDDGDPCTVADECSAGKCVGVGVPCDCQEDADCLQLDDGDLCNGTLFCDTGALPFKCTVVPGSEIECPEPQVGADAICLQAECDPGTGACSLAPDHEGYACNDGDFCTIGDVCADGKCEQGVAAVCADNNLCTDDVCLPGEGCEFSPNDELCDDQNACTVGDQCEAGECVAGEETLGCDDANPCTVDSCLPTSGCQSVPTDGECDDNNECTTGDACKNGWCVPAGTADCDDGNSCTQDSCDPPTGCVHEPLGGSCSDGDPCTSNDQCVNGACVAGPGLDCNDGNSCTLDSCVDGQCHHENIDAECDDGNACTVGDACIDGTCTFKAALACNDQDLCTTDACDPLQGCIHSLNEAPCDDGSVCTIGDHCHLGACISSGELTCDDGNPCTDDVCNAVSGCSFSPNQAPCNDSNACTLEDKCNAGACQPGQPLSCDDQDPCTDDSCAPLTGCLHENNTAPCEDGDACFENDKCQEGICVSGEAVDCEDYNVCTDDSCAPDAGCINAPNTVACEDGNVCTESDVCAGGVCQPGGAMDCNDNNICTDDSCDVQNGCEHDNVVDGTGCGQDLECWNGECASSCENGTTAFDYTGGAQTFVVPACVLSVHLEVWGGQGGSNANPQGQAPGPLGGKSEGDLTVAPGTTLHIFVGGSGDSGGWNGGGGVNGGWQQGRGGGGSDVRVGGTALQNRVIVAGGAGAHAPYSLGYGGWHDARGGAGGGLTGGDGENSNGNAPPAGGGKGGTQNGGGAKGNDVGGNPSSAGSLGQGGDGGGEGDNDHCGAGGGGGGGFYGGGGGGHHNCGGGGGGGGSSYVGGVSNGNTTPGVRSGHGRVVITY